MGGAFGWRAGMRAPSGGVVDAIRLIGASVSDSVRPMHFREVIRMPLWLIALIYFFFLSFVISVWAALGNAPAIAVFVALTLSMVFIALRSSLVISVSEKELRVGRAHIERKFIVDAIELDSAAMQLLRGRDANPAAYLAFRFWASTGVKVVLNDKRDETPYWLITSNKANQLVNALKTN